jgi:hypothetical protein
MDGDQVTMLLELSFRELASRFLNVDQLINACLDPLWVAHVTTV